MGKAGRIIQALNGTGKTDDRQKDLLCRIMKLHRRSFYEPRIQSGVRTSRVGKSDPGGRAAWHLPVPRQETR